MWPYFERLWNLADRAFRFVTWTFILGTILAIAHQTNNWVFWLASMLLDALTLVVIIAGCQRLAFTISSARNSKIEADVIAFMVFLLILASTGFLAVGFLKAVLVIAAQHCR